MSSVATIRADGMQQSPKPPRKRRTRPKRQTSTSSLRFTILRERGSRGALALLIIGAPLLLGGGPFWAIVAIATISLAGLAWIARATPRAAQVVPAIAMVMAVCAGWTALQALALPCSWIERIAPDSVRQLTLAFVALGRAPPTLCALSRDPGATQQEIVKGVAILAAFMAAWLYAANGGRRYVLWLIAGSSLAMALVALAHAAFGLDRVFGMYSPIEAQRELLLAPLLNPNHLGAYVALGAPLWIGLTYKDDNPNIRLLGYVAVLIACITTALTLSRGAIGQLVASLLLMVWRTALRSSRGGTSRTNKTVQRVGIAIAIAAALGIATYFVGERIQAEFRGNDFSKLELVGNAFRFALGNIWLGVGRGAFASTFVGVEGRTARFNYPENLVAQWLTEWGLPITLLLIGTLVVSLARIRKEKISASRFGAITALGCYAAQNLVDFGFEQLGIAVVVATLLAACLAPSPHRERTDALPQHKTDLFAWGTIGVGGLAVAMIALWNAPQQVRAQELSLREHMAANDQTSFRRVLSAAVEQHPSEPSFPALAAANEVQRRGKSAGRWLNRTMQLAPGWALPHYLAYRWLLSSGRTNQALLELRAALEVEIDSHNDEVCRLVDKAPQLALVAAPRGDNRRRYLEIATQCVGPGHPSESAINDVLLREYPDSTLALERKALDLDRSGHSEEGLDVLGGMLRNEPRDERALALRAGMLARAGHPQAALDAVNAALPLIKREHSGDFLGVKAFALAALGQAEPAAAAIAEIRRLAGTNIHELAESFVLEGRVQIQLRHPGQAFRAFQQAYRIDQDPSHLSDLARLAEEVGDRPQALWAYVQLCEQEPHGGSCLRRDQLRAPPSGALPH